ncbi:hypothetical protein PLGE761_01020 [Pluralibacter gergoviae]|nr:hypothetical protein AZ034_002672 [Pluralibacter gergoviae]OUF53796.1 hypothetical protein AZ044_000025 [Pluralibacter gergoviae]SUB72113.1 Uncharacterised protein [Pluralibacter gergoviae]
MLFKRIQALLYALKLLLVNTFITLWVWSSTIHFAILQKILSL